MDDGKITILAALTRVSGETSGPLTASEIVDKVLSQPLSLNGKTPRASVQAQLYTAAKRGELFRRTGRGMFESIAV